jgi:hypothetical protein
MVLHIDLRCLYLFACFSLFLCRRWPVSSRAGVLDSPVTTSRPRDRARLALSWQPRLRSCRVYVLTHVIMHCNSLLYGNGMRCGPVIYFNINMSWVPSHVGIDDAFILVHITHEVWRFIKWPRQAFQLDSRSRTVPSHMALTRARVRKRVKD